MPLNEIVCGLVGVLSEIVNTPVALPATVGLKVIVIVQLLPAATLVAQVPPEENGPVTAMLAMFRLELPLLVRVTI